MKSPYTCRQCLSLIRRSHSPWKPPQSLRPLSHGLPARQNHTATNSAPPKQLSLPRRTLSTSSRRPFDKPFEPFEYVDPEGIRRKLVLSDDNLFHLFTHSPIPQIRKRAAFMRQHAYCPHPSHQPT